MSGVVRLRQQDDRDEQAPVQTPISIVRPQPELDGQVIDRKEIEELGEIWAECGGLPDDELVAQIQKLRDMMSRNALPLTEQEKIKEQATKLHTDKKIPGTTYERILDILCPGR